MFFYLVGGYSVILKIFGEREKRLVTGAFESVPWIHSQIKASNGSECSSTLRKYGVDDAYTDIKLSV